MMILSLASLQTVNSCRSYDIVNGSLTFVARMNSRIVSSMFSSEILHWIHGMSNFAASSLPAATSNESSVPQV